LAGLGDERALPELLPLFAHEHAPVRQAAVAAVNSIGAEGTAMEIGRRLTDADPRVRECAVRVAGYFGFDTSIPGIVNALADEHEDVRRAAIEQLPVVDDPRAVDHLVAALRRESPRNRAAAAHALRVVDDAAVAAPLIEALDDADSWVRYFAAGSLGRHHDRGVTGTLTQTALNDPATPVRIAAVQALGDAADPAVLAVVRTLLEEDDEDLACAAIAAIGRLPGDEADDLLERMVRTSSGARRAAAVDAWSRRISRRAVDVLTWAARLVDVAAVPQRAIEGLRSIASAGDERETQAAAVTALLDLAAEPSMRGAAVRAFGGLPAHAVSLVADALTSPRLATRLAAVDALARMQHPRASEELRRALDDESAAVRAAAVVAFGRLGTPSVGRLVAAMRIVDPDAAVRRRAAAVCDRHGWGPGPIPVKR
jgi:HEAT repeat protein